MPKTGLNDHIIRKYLLLQASNLERELVELRLLTDLHFLEYVEMVEDEMIDDYVYNHLSPKDRLRFEQHFLFTPERIEKLRFAQALFIFLTEKRAQKKASSEA
jgi:hypothetical protein